MQISPRYDGPPILEIPSTWHEQLAPLVRQRRRMERTLAGLSFDQWQTQSRCALGTVQDVIAHLTGVNDETLEQFIASNDSFLGVMEQLSDGEWHQLAESPAGHVPIRLIDCLSIRSPLPVDAPAEWRTLVGGLAAAFDAPDQSVLG